MLTEWTPLSLLVVGSGWIVLIWYLFTSLVPYDEEDGE